MARKLYRFVTPFMVLAIVLGLWRLSFQWEYYLSSGWMIAKLVGGRVFGGLPLSDRRLCGTGLPR